MKEITSVQEFIQFIKSEDTVLVDFFATWCGPCRALAPVLEEVSAQGYPVAKVDVDKFQELSEKLSISSVPTLITFKNGQIGKIKKGARPKSEIIAMFD